MDRFRIKTIISWTRVGKSFQMKQRARRAGKERDDAPDRGRSRQATAAFRSSMARHSQVERGQIVALLGGNGTGKSTLLKAVSGPDQAVARLDPFDGERIDGLRPASHRAARPGPGDAGQGSLSGHDGRGESAARRLRRPATAPGATRALERVFAYFPVLKERRRQLAANALRRRSCRCCASAAASCPNRR